MAFDFGCARTRYADGQHPRLLISADELVALRRQTHTGQGAKLLAALREKTDRLIATVTAADDLPALLAHHTVRSDPMGEHVFQGAGDIALVAALTADAGAVTAATRILDAMPAAERLGPRDSYAAGYASWGTLQLAYDLMHPQLTPAARRRFAGWAARISVRHTVRKLKRTDYLKCAGANVPMVGMISAFLSLLAIEGDDGAGDLSAEKARLLEMFDASLFAVMGRNGYPWEDIGYGSGMVSLLARLVAATRRAGIYDAYTACPRYARFGNAMLHFVQPWGKFLFNTGDYGADFGWRSVVFPRLAAATDDPALLWLHGTLSYPVASSGPGDMAHRRIGFPELELAPGFQVPVDAYSLITLPDLKKPVHPARTKRATQYVDPDRGLVSFRSSWHKDAVALVVDGSQRSCAAQGHDHSSGGHISVSALGERFAIDTGRYNIEQDQHNVVLADGVGGQNTDGQWRASLYQATLTDYQTGAFVDTASVNNAQQADCIWSFRHAALVKGGRGPSYVWVVDDVNAANDFRQFWFALNTAPDNRVETASDHGSIVGAAHGNIMDAFVIVPGAQDYPRKHRVRFAADTQVCGSPAYIGQPRKKARAYADTVGNTAYGPQFARPRLLAKVSGYCGRFMTLLLPRRQADPLPVVEQLAAPTGTLAVRLRIGDVEDTLVWAFDHSLLEAGEVSGRGRWALVRTSAKTGRVLRHATGRGERLSFRGRDLPVE
jgi:hypothetical protein